MITLAGVIGSGKSSLTRILADELHTTPFFEPVADNPVLPSFIREMNRPLRRGQMAIQMHRTRTHTYFKPFLSIADLQ